MTTGLIIFSALSFIFFGLGCLFAERLKAEFRRYHLARWRVLTGSLQLLGATGLIVGFWFPWAALAGSGGLSLLMLLGVGVRLKIKDSLLQTTPALFYMLLNAWILWELVTV